MSRSRNIRVLVADDSPLVREIVTNLLESDTSFRVVGQAASGDEAAALADKLRPDVITMDLAMPGSDGFAGIGRIMAQTPTPILVLSSNREEVKGFRALSLGALDLLEKPQDPSLGAFGNELRSRLRLLSTVPVIRHPRGLKDSQAAALPAGRPRAEVVVIGASLGGPKALATVLRGLPRTFPAAIAVVQHIADGFTMAFTRWLGLETGFKVIEASGGEALEPGVVLVASSHKHLVLRGGTVALNDGPPLHGFRPSVSALFRSAAECYGARACGVMLTGMGDDGADGLLQLRKAGALTVAQDEASCAVFGMPRAAIELGAVERVLPLDEIPRALTKVTA
jgi:two-component system chemotaxis response regulator CheB